MKAQNTSPVKHRHHRNREVITSRFLPSPSTSVESTEFHSPSSVIRRSSIRSSEDDNNNRRHRITEEKDSVLRRQLW
ncbi:hypothetical protein A2U01_0010822, partial [Trifolium medium]|nr:hypothetical protein [Trifolium medium]